VESFKPLPLRARGRGSPWSRVRGFVGLGDHLGVVAKRIFGPAGSPTTRSSLNPLNAKLNPICHLLALFGAHHILHISRIRVNSTPLYRYLHSLSVLVDKWKLTPISGSKFAHTVLLPTSAVFSS